MSLKKTIFVLGAGASAEANLPTGVQLKQMIAASLTFTFERGHPISGDKTMFWTLQQEPNIDECFRAAELIRKAIPQASSIDEFIENHRGNIAIERCGKLAIVRSILQAERASALYVNPDNIYNELNFGSVENTWFNIFWQQITKNCQVDKLDRRFSSIAFIVFNYDRCLEHYLYRSIQNYYNVSADDAGHLVSSIKIYHPYGTIGSLPWSDDQVKVEFGAEPIVGQLGDLANQIKTFTEGTDPRSSDVVAIRNDVAQADRLIFLGFAYHQQNINLLKCEEKFGSNPTAKCWGTAHGISENDLPVIKRELGKLYGDNMQRAMEIRDLKCRELFETYTRDLAFV